ncbi:C40 family peptidase [Paenibacillus sp.]|uniref:C40 family peptidase n=1 Tax=Paenibacillus sp. TaxID=58172 RepID=UPI0039C96ABB
MGVKSRVTSPLLSQARVGTEVKKDELHPGDLIFFNTDGKGISHAGIYMGDDQFSHASSGKGVQISKLSEAYYAKRNVTARRVALSVKIIRP